MKTSEYKFTIVDCGAYGRASDGGIFAQSEFGKCLNSNDLNIPVENYKLSLSNIEMLYYFVADEAFPISKRVMRPYPGQFLDEKSLFLTIDYQEPDVSLKIHSEFLSQGG